MLEGRDRLFIAYAENQEEVFLGHSISRQQNVSEATAQKIDMEVRRIIEESYQRANKILTDRMNDLHTIAKGLLEYETLTGEEIKGLLRGERPVCTPTRSRNQPSRRGPRPPSRAPVVAGGPGGIYIARNRSLEHSNQRTRSCRAVARSTKAGEPQPGTWRQSVGPPGRSGLGAIHIWALAAVTGKRRDCRKVHLDRWTGALQIVSIQKDPCVIGCTPP